jgi:hypothetical protein
VKLWLIDALTSRVGTRLYFSDFGTNQEFAPKSDLEPRKSEEPGDWTTP